MGIRFHCRHCRRRLNVKTAQAGLAGQCPHCQKLVDVPRQSTLAAQARKPSSSKRVDRLAAQATLDESDDRSQVLNVDDQVTLDGVMAGDHESFAKIPVAAGPRFRRQTKVAPVADAGEAFLLGRPSPTPGLEGGDPIESAPKKIWYFRTRGIGERGPIKGRQMRQSIDNGEVIVGSKVWREDWDDWVDAEDVFPELAEQARTIRKKNRLRRALTEAGMPTESTGGDGDSSSDVSAMRRSQTVVTWLVVGGLAIVFTLTLVVIAIVNQ